VYNDEVGSSYPFISSSIWGATAEKGDAVNLICTSCKYAEFSLFSGELSGLELASQELLLKHLFLLLN
jgi:hypothetical protein